MLYFWHDLHVSACQLDELWSFVHTKEAHLPGAKGLTQNNVSNFASLTALYTLGRIV
jgi:hypothetical protein